MFSPSRGFNFLLTTHLYLPYPMLQHTEIVPGAFRHGVSKLNSEPNIDGSLSDVVCYYLSVSSIG